MKKQIEADLRSLISGISNNLELEQLKSIIDEQIAAHTDDPMNFIYHTKVDNYFYYVVYEDGSQHMGCIGQREYENYLHSTSAVSLWRRNKDYLWKKGDYPMELLMQKA